MAAAGHRNPPWPLLPTALGAQCVVVSIRLGLVAAVLVAAAACGSDSDDVATTSPEAPTSEVATPPPPTTASTTAAPATTEPAPSDAAVFSFGRDRLCDWFSAEKIAELVAAEYDWNGTATERGPERYGLGCAWTLSGEGERNGVVLEHATPAEAPFVEHVPENGYSGAEYGVGVSGHPELSDGVIYYRGNMTAASFGVPDRGFVTVLIWVPGDDEFMYGAKHFAFADAVVQELGWTPDDPRSR